MTDPGSLISAAGIDINARFVLFSFAQDRVMDMEHTVLLNVSLLPTTSVAERLIQCSERLRDIGIFVLNPETRIPHLTLYMARFPVSAVDRVAQLLVSTLAEAEPLELLSEGWFRTSGNYLEVGYAPTTHLRDLQDAVIARIASLRFIPASYDSYFEDYFGAYSGDQQRNVRDCGYDLAGDSFRPHVTVTRVRDGAALDVSTLPRSDGYSFYAETAALVEADRLGAGRRMIRRYNIGS